MWWMFLIVDVASKCPSCLCSTSNQLNIPSFPACDYVNTQHFPTKENINIGPVLYQGSFHQDTVGSNAPQLVQGSATSINFVIAGHFTWLRVVIWGWTRLGMLASCPLVTGIQDARSLFRPLVCLVGRQVNYFPHKFSHNWHTFTATNLPHASASWKLEPRNNISKQSWRHARHAGDSDVHHPPESPGLN